MTERQSRETEGRDSDSRKKVWTPPTALETPEPPEGFLYRWVNYELLGEDRAGNVYGRSRQHYELVKADELSGFDTETVEEGRYAGVVRSGDLILMKVPTEIAEQRKDYYKRQTETMQASVDQEMESRGHKDMPFEKDRRTEVSLGKRSAKIED